MEDCVETQTGGLRTASGSEMVRRKTPRGWKDRGVCSLTPSVSRCSSSLPRSPWNGAREGQTFVLRCFSLSHLLLLQFKIGASKSRPEVTGGKDRAWVVFVLWDYGPNFLWGFSFSLALFDTSVCIYSLVLTYPKDGKHILQLGQGLDTSRGSAIGIIRIHG